MEKTRRPSALLAGIVAAISGAAIVVGTIALGSFSRADAGEAATDLVRSEMTSEGLERHRADFEIVTAAVEQLYAEAFPAIASRLGLSPFEFERDLSLRYPAVAEFTPGQRREGASAFAEKILVNLEAHQQDFEEADAIPVTWMPMDVGPWLAVGLGIVLLVVGVATILRPRVIGLAVIAILGAALVAGPLLTRFPQKAGAARDLLDSLTFTPEVVTETRALMDAAAAAIEEIEEELLPDLAGRLGLTEAELDELIAEAFPAIAVARPQLEGILHRYELRVRMREGGLDVIPTASDYPLTAIAWWAIALGAATMVPAAAALIVRRRSAARPEHNML